MHCSETHFKGINEYQCFVRKTCRLSKLASYPLCLKAVIRNFQIQVLYIKNGGQWKFRISSKISQFQVSSLYYFTLHLLRV